VLRGCGVLADVSLVGAAAGDASAAFVEAMLRVVLVNGRVSRRSTLDTHAQTPCSVFAVIPPSVDCGQHHPQMAHLYKDLVILSHKNVRWRGIGSKNACLHVRAAKSNDRPRAAPAVATCRAPNFSPRMQFVRTHESRHSRAFAHAQSQTLDNMLSPGLLTLGHVASGRNGFIEHAKTKRPFAPAPLNYNALNCGWLLPCGVRRSFPGEASR
jgi:hypothetical protein